MSLSTVCGLCVGLTRGKLLRLHPLQPAGLTHIYIHTYIYAYFGVYSIMYYICVRCLRALLISAFILRETPPTTASTTSWAHAYIYTHTHTHIYIYIYIYARIFAFSQLCNMYVSTVCWLWFQHWPPLHVYIRTHIFIYIHIYTYIYIHIYIYIYIYIYTHI